MAAAIQPASFLQGGVQKQSLSNRDKTDSAIQKLFPENMPRELIYNGMRDPTWTVVSALNVNEVGRMMPYYNPSASISSQMTSSAFVETMGAQWLFGSLPMFLLAGGETIYRMGKGEKLSAQETSKIWAPAAAASLAIPMWDLGQLIGTHIGTMGSYSASMVGLLAAPFTGIFEGFTQWGVKYVFDLATNETKQEMWRQDPSLMGKLLVKEVVLNTTIGAIPGAVWQIVFFFALSALIGALGPVGGIIVTALLVGLAVMICNYGCTHAINKVSAAVDKCFGWDIQCNALEQRIKAEQEERKENERLEQKRLKALLLEQDSTASA